MVSNKFIVLLLVLMSFTTSLIADKTIDFENPERFNEDLHGFRNELKAYVNDQAHVIAFTESFANWGTDSEQYLRENFFFGTVETLWQLEIRGSLEEYVDGNYILKASFTDSGCDNNEINIENDKLVLTCGDKTSNYTLATGTLLESIRNNVNFKPLPASARDTLHVYKFADRDEYIFLDIAQYNEGRLRLLVGQLGHMNEVQIKRTLFVDDGGTTTIITTENNDQLFAASPYNPYKDNWNGEELIELPPSYDPALLGIPVAEVPSLVTPCGELPSI